MGLNKAPGTQLGHSEPNVLDARHRSIRIIMRCHFFFFHLHCKVPVVGESVRLSPRVRLRPSSPGLARVEHLILNRWRPDTLPSVRWSVSDGASAQRGAGLCECESLCEIISRLHCAFSEREKKKPSQSRFALRSKQNTVSDCFSVLFESSPP